MTVDLVRPAVRAEGLVKRRGGRRVLDGIELELPPGSVTSVAGANGSGKSTLLQVLAGLMNVSAGRVDGRPKRVGYLPERFVPPSSMDAASYLAHMGRLKGMSAGAIRLRRAELAEALAVAPGIDVGLDQLSKGNLQKVGLIQAFLADETMIVLDEPRTGLDEQGSLVLDELIAAACARGAAVLVSEHDAIVLERAARVCQLVAGRLRWPGAPYKAGDALSMSVRVRRPAGAPSATLQVHAVHQVNARADGVIEVVVAPADCERTLVAVIGQGCSVVEVRDVRPAANRSDSC